MASGTGIRITTDQVAQIASNIESENKKLSAELQNSKKTVDNLSTVWEGEAARATIEAYASFAQKYFQNYEEVINQYVKFLRQVVNPGYEQVEQANISLADNFK